MDSYIQFCKGLDKHINKTFAKLLKQSEAESQALISTSLETDSKGDFLKDKIGVEVRLHLPKIFRKTDVIKYCILSWYLDPWTQFELQEFLRRKCTQMKYYEVETLYLYSKDLMKYTLFRENDCTLGSLFGNILQPGVFVNNYYQTPEGPKKIRKKRTDFCFLSMQFRNRPRKTVYRRGYKDKGSLPPWDKKARTEANISLNYYEYELERQREQLLAKNKQLELIYEMKTKGIDS